MELYNPDNTVLTKYIFFTGKGGVGKTSVACATAVKLADEEVVVIDTAPTGHTLLQLDSSQTYHKEVERTHVGNIPESVKRLLPKLRSDETEVIIVTLAEATPVYEAMRLEEDLKRAKIPVKWWIVNSSFAKTATSNPLLKAKASHEISWIKKISEHSSGNFAVIGWMSDEVKNENLKKLL